MTKCLDKGHELTLVVGKPTAIEALGASFLATLRLKRGRQPFAERIGRLHVIVAIKQEVRRAAGVGAVAIMGDHHGMAGRVAQAGGKAEAGQLFAQPARGLAAVVLVVGIGRYGRDAGQFEQALDAAIKASVDCGEYFLHLGHGTMGQWETASRMRIQLRIPPK